MITACAELARRLVTGESPGGNGSKQDGKVDSWFTKIEKPKDEDDGKSSGKTLVVVGYVVDYQGSSHALIVTSEHTQLEKNGLSKVR